MEDLHGCQPRRRMLKGSRAIRDFTLVIVLAVSFAAAVVSWLLARSLSKPIQRLIRSMRDVERGNFSVPFSFDREDEIGLLERSYGKMVNRLDELIQSIEEKERQKRHAELLRFARGFSRIFCTTLSIPSGCLPSCSSLPKSQSCFSRSASCCAPT